MNVIGMGPLEILVVLLLAFILLGPQKMVEGAKMLGKASKELRRMADEFPTIVLDEGPATGPRSTPSQPGASDAPSTTPAKDNDDESGKDGPVTFQSSRSGEKTDSAEEK